jgi:hypothetical protein
MRAPSGAARAAGLPSWRTTLKLPGPMIPGARPTDARRDEMRCGVRERRTSKPRDGSPDEDRGEVPWQVGWLLKINVLN